MTKFRWMNFLKVPTRATSDSSELPASTKFVHNAIEAGGGSGGSGSSLSFSVTQTAHGFTALTPIFYDIAANAWAKAKADSKDTLATHVVTAVADADTFTAGQAGKFTITGHGLAEGYWFTSAETAGAVTQSDVSYSNPVFFVIDADTIFLPSYRPAASEGLFGMSECVAVTGAITLGATAVGKLHDCSGTSADYTVVLPSPASYPGKYIGFSMNPALTKLVTLDATASYTIDGERYRIMWAKEVAILRSNGVTWTKVAGKTIPMMVTLRVNADVIFAASTQTTVPFDTMVTSNCPASMVDLTNKRVNLLRRGVWDFDGMIQFNYDNSTSVNAILALIISAISGWTTSDVTKNMASGYATRKISIKQKIDVDTAYAYLAARYDGGSSTLTMKGYTTTTDARQFFSVTEVPTW